VRGVREVGSIVELGALLLIIVEEWENIVTFMNVTVSKGRLCEERHCKRSKVKL
jgi:hypothetical protein